MHKISLLLTLISLFFLKSFSQTNNLTTVATYVPSVQTCVCDSVVVIDTVLVDMKTLKELQKVLPVLDSLQTVIDVISTTRSTLFKTMDSLNRIRQHGHFLIDSILADPYGDRNNSISRGLTQILPAAQWAKTFEEMQKNLNLKEDENQIAFNALVFPAQPLFRKVLGRGVLEKVFCRDAVVYKEGRKLFTLTYYFQRHLN
jgi:hypothetical protein